MDKDEDPEQNFNFDDMISTSVKVQTEVTVKSSNPIENFCSLRDNIACVQCSLPAMCDHATDPPAKTVMKSKQVQAAFKKPTFVERCLSNTQSCKETLGIELEFFNWICDQLAPVNSSRKLTKEDKIAAFFMKLKFNLPFTFLGHIFNVHRTTIAEAFVTVLEAYYDFSKDRIWWLSKEEVKATMPMCFKKHYPNTRVIIDASEVQIEVPASVDAQILFYSNYKARHTIKFLVGIAPSGIVTFISNSYGGRVTDGHLTADSGFFDLLEPGDEVMSDKGFPDIERSLFDRNAMLVMPPFQKTGQQFTEQENIDCYNIASVRIHVERAIARLKQFEILKKLENSLLQHVHKILVCIAFTANNFAPLIKQ